ncbi:carboxymuconolactone decarboxylase family protein [Leptospira sp. GIMC2001]|uniref:carboxymuconolactone decarboxylase family protein n=1 Tax=Leptospira sp. GIMC2001 TaxID=1513297 RepID=UPI0023491FE0|nr:carboxymuconolactone decarboxylase family protein [Leptospira sp. GIMC2001]WCL48325.1 carboxymuconolactone decarboxylase family protein [Leptospira sp. GIMC2001]
MRVFTVPTKEEVSSTNQGIFDNLKAGLGFVPNLYATIGKSNFALDSYLKFQNAKSSLSGKEREAINLVVSQFNHCVYCLSAHTAIGKMKGFSDQEIMEIRKGIDNFNPKLKSLTRLIKSVMETKGKPDAKLVENFFDAGYTEENLIDAIVIVGDKIISNYIHGITQIPVDFPVAEEI